ncbi:LacI family DNA-binding transcriptional regulator [Solirhodobacter olei]|uniref:LacI family DNA-binding transcriptional regulator n=1 Tax=Solirhodobacter olei TaxID=2493082 RepID=UPI0013E38FE7|nr:LacI family DNA-binding transcriptional regulator [Solirhodobacter olei]
MKDKAAKPGGRAAPAQKRPAHRLTMADVARRAGVSTATVSRALTRPDQVNEKTRDLVRGIAEELGFRPNLIGRQLRVRAATSLLILVQDLDNPFYAELIKGAEAVARANHLSVMVGGTDGLEEVEQLYSEQFLGRRVDGLVILFGHLPAGISPKMAEHSPIVLVSEDNPALNLSSVLVDNVGWAERAMGYLMERGHRRIAHITGPLARIISRQRQEGYWNALAKAGLPQDPALEALGDFSFERGRAAARELLSLPDRPTAIFCANDEAAVGAILGAADLGLSVPSDVSLIGFDDIMLAQISQPPLTTIRQPRQQMGAAAAQLLIDMIEHGPGKRAHKQLDCELIERSSVRSI